MKWKIGAIFIAIILAVGMGFIVYFTLFNQTENEPESEPASGETNEASEAEEDIDRNVVNEPVDKSIFVLADGTDGHTFISQNHQFYNQTLGWGRIETTDYSKQKQKAQEILEKLEGAQIQNEDLAADIESIKHYATTVTQKDDRDAMRMLHRYFHDLDIYLNGYDYNQTWDVTTFKPNR